jgi:8-oxo-dGTP pyrophosphatase MutT (NUDIX family)
MQTELAAFLNRHTARAEEEVVWGSSGLAFRVTSYLAAEIPPLTYITSVRALVFHESSVLLWYEGEAVHLFPGGRREPGETLEATLRREVLEETGWRLAAPSLLGFMQFHHRRPKPEGYPHPYPDFLQLVFQASASERAPGARRLDTDPAEPVFVPIEEVLALDLSPGQRLFLKAATLSRGS